MVNNSLLGKTTRVSVCTVRVSGCAHILHTYILIYKHPQWVLCGNMCYGTEKSNLWIRYLFGWLISETIKIN